MKVYDAIKGMKVFGGWGQEIEAIEQLLRDNARLTAEVERLREKLRIATDDADGCHAKLTSITTPVPNMADYERLREELKIARAHADLSEQPFITASN